MLHSRYERGIAALLVALVRAASGGFVALVGPGKFADHASEAMDFRHYGIPAPDLAVWTTGAVEILCGTLLVVGLLTRPAAALLALTLVGAISTAGRVDGGSFHLGVAPTLLAVMLALLWLGPGRPALDAMVERRITARGSPATPAA